MSDKPGCLAACAAKRRPTYRSSEAVIEDYGNWQRPSEAKAREKYQYHHSHHGVYDLSTSTKTLQDFGDGIAAYFTTLKLAAFTFAILAVVPGLFLMVFNGLGGWYDTADLERTMLGNYGLLSYDGPSTGVNGTAVVTTKTTGATSEGAVTALFASSIHQGAATMWGMNKRGLLVAMSVLDLAGLIFFFVFCAYLIYLARARRAASSTASGAPGSKSVPASSSSVAHLSDYSVRVRRLPPDTTAEALQAYLLAVAGEGAEIVEVELCRKVHSLLALVVERGEVVRKMEEATAILQRKAEVNPRVRTSVEEEALFQRYVLEDITESIREEQAATKSNEVVAAFVTFSTCEARYRVMQALPRSAMRRWRMPPDRKFNNGGQGRAGRRPVSLDVSPAPDPSDVLYENLEYTAMGRAWRTVLSNAAKYLVLLVGFLLVSLAPAMRMGLASLESGPDKTTCDANCSYRDAGGNYKLTDANRELYKQCDTKAGTGTFANKLDCEAITVCYECFCRGALNAGSYGELSYCSRFSRVVVVSTAAQLVAVLGVVAANAMIEFAITWLVRQEKHHTRSREAVGIVRGLFICQFANTALANLVANMYLPGPANVVYGSFLAGYIFTGTLSDTSPSWYRLVARPITISVAVTTAMVNLKIAVRWVLRKRALAWRYTALTQAQLDAAYEGHDFNLALKYGQHMYVIFVVMTYSGGVPLMYLLAAVHFTLCFWSEKWELLRVCKRPMAYSSDLAVYVSTTLPFAGLWHAGFGLWMYSLFGTQASPLIMTVLRRSLEHSVRAFKSIIPAASCLTSQVVAWRFTQASSAHLFIGFIAAGGAIFMYFTLSWWLAASRWLASLFGCIQDSGASEVDCKADAPDLVAAVRSQLLVGPSSYAVQLQPAYAPAFVRMEGLEWGKSIKQMPADAAPADTTDNSKALTRRKRTAANRLRAKQHAAAAPGVWVAPAPSTASAISVTPGPRPSRSQVAPEPLLPPPPLQPFDSRGISSVEAGKGQPASPRGTATAISVTVSAGSGAAPTPPPPGTAVGVQPPVQKPSQQFVSKSSSSQLPTTTVPLHPHQSQPPPQLTSQNSLPPPPQVFPLSATSSVAVSGPPLPGGAGGGAGGAAAVPSLAAENDWVSFQQPPATTAVGARGSSGSVAGGPTSRAGSVQQGQEQGQQTRGWAELNIE